MPAKLNFKIFVLFICLCAFVSAAVAQEKAQALKFDEFNDAGSGFGAYSDEVSLTQRTERFVKQLKKERGAKVYIIYYQARITDAASRFNYKIYRIQGQILSETPVKSEDIVVIDGGYRDANTVEFWIAPKNAEPPVPTPTFDKSETFICPNIFVYNDTPAGYTGAVNFHAPAHNFKGIENYSLLWRVSKGEIIEGQGLNILKVKLNDSAVKRVTAYLEVSGLPFPCPKIFSGTAEVNGKLRQVDEFGMVTHGDIKARMDNFMVELQNEPTTMGYIVIYGNRSERNRDVVRRETMIRNYITFRNFYASRITFVRGGFRENISTELWLAFNNAAPVPAPTVNEKFVITAAPTKKSRPRKK